MSKWKGPLATLLDECKRLPDEWTLSLVFDCESVHVRVENPDGQVEYFGQYGQPIGDMVSEAMESIRASVPQ